MKEYYTEHGHTVDFQTMQSSRLPLPAYQLAHQALVQVCHDIVVEYQGGALLVLRDNFPAKGLLYPVGGRVERGMPTEESVRLRVKAECNLDVYDTRFLGCARTFFHTEPFGHGKGTDTVNLLYFARGKGELRLDDLHSQPTIVRPADYTQDFRNQLDEYVRDLLDLTMPLIRELEKAL